jgi:hypothetical protein
VEHIPDLISSIIMVLCHHSEKFNIFTGKRSGGDMLVDPNPELGSNLKPSQGLNIAFIMFTTSV